MRRILWTLGMGLAGLFLGVKGQDTLSDAWFTVLSTIWAAGIGFGLGSIFDQTTAAKWIVIYWVATLALVGPLLALLIGSGIYPDASKNWQSAFGAGGALAGIFVGFVFGNMHLRRLSRKPESNFRAIPD